MKLGIVYSVVRSLSVFTRMALLAVLVYPWSLYPCTTFSFKNQNQERVFAKSFDWFDGHGMLFTNKRNMQKEALVLDGTAPLSWVSRFGSVTFNQHARDFPLGGMNEAGLVVEIMVGPTEDIPASPELKSVNEVQWIQYVLDSFSTIPEVIQGLQGIRVARVSSKVHYLVCDKAADCATFEYLNGELVTHSGASLPYKAFTNSSYEDSADYASNFSGLGGNQLTPNGTASLARFTRAALAAKNFSSGNAISYAHNVLDNVAISGKWRIVYQGLNEISFRTSQFLTNEKRVQMTFDFECTTPVKNYRMSSAFDTGLVNQKFEDYTVEENTWLVEQNSMLPYELQQALIAYPDTNTLCLTSLK